MSESPFAFPELQSATGEMAERMRATDWSRTSLGPMQDWPHSLRVAIGICISSRFPMFVWWGPQLINIYNDAYIPVLGKRHPEALGRPARDIWGEIWPVIGPQADAVMQRGESTWNERVQLVMERNGYAEDTWFTWSYSPIPDETGGVGGLFCACTDETRHVLAERARDRFESELRESEENYRSTVQLLPQIPWTADPKGNILGFSPKWLELTGLTRDSALGSGWEQVPHPQDLARMSEAWSRSIGTGEPYDIEHRVRLADGTYRWMRSCAYPRRDETGLIIRWYGTTEDIHGRKAAEEQLSQSQRRLQTLFENAQDAILLTDGNARFVDANPAAWQLTGYDRDELLQLHVWGLTRSTDHETTARMWREFIETGRQGGEYQLIRKDGSTVDAEYRAVANILPGLHLSVLRDVSARNRAADRIGRLHAVAAALSEALTTADVAHVAVDQGIAALGATAGSLSLLSDDGQFLEMLGSIGYETEIIQPWQRFSMDAPIPLTDAIRTGDVIYLDNPEERVRRYPALAGVKSRRETQASACIPLSIGDKTIGVLGLSFDHTSALEADDRRFLLSLGRQCAQALERARLFEAERRARAEAERASRAKDEFLAVLSHELRTPLTPVLLTVSLLESNPLLPPSLKDDVAVIRRNVELESRLISDLLDLTRIAKGKLQLEQQDVDLHPIIRAAIEICQRELSAKLRVELHAKRHIVRGDSTRLQQIFWNLINNAQKFTNPDGHVTVRSSDTDSGIRVEVIDNGIGIDAELLTKLFTAFEQGEVRSSHRQAGLGLGLSISKQLVEAQGGTIQASSEGRGRGAKFTVEFPVVAASAPKTSTNDPSSPTSDVQPLSVLLVEDHEPTLRAMVRLLTHLGHQVTGVNTVAGATLAGRQDGFDLLISDLGLPDGSGLDVMRELRDRYKGRAIALSGYGMDSDIAASRDAGFAEHLTKPVDLSDLEAAIRRVVTPVRGA